MQVMQRPPRRAVTQSQAHVRSLRSTRSTTGPATAPAPSAVGERQCQQARLAALLGWASVAPMQLPPRETEAAHSGVSSAGSHKGRARGGLPASNPRASKPTRSGYGA